MIIAQVVTADASEYERKSQRIDAAALAASGHTIVEDVQDAEIVHVYAGRELPRLELRKPFFANVGSKKRRFAFRRGAEPREIVTPFNVPEAIDDAYFETLNSNLEPPRSVRTSALRSTTCSSRRWPGSIATAPMWSGVSFRILPLHKT